MARQRPSTDAHFDFHSIAALSPSSPSSLSTPFIRLSGSFYGRGLGMFVPLSHLEKEKGSERVSAGFHVDIGRRQRLTLGLTHGGQLSSLLKGEYPP